MLAGTVTLALGCVLFASSTAIAQQPQDGTAGPHARVELIAERGGIVPGQRIRAGLRFALAQGWHIYWLNSGDSGEPPKVQWKLPAGFEAGAMEWPYPVRLGSGTIVDYGYEGSVLLIVPMTAPRDLHPDARVTLAGDVKWLACREICVPERASVSLTLAVKAPGAAAPSPSAKLFEQTELRIPKPAPKAWKQKAVFEKGDFELTVETGARETSATFFPLEALEIENSAAQAVKPFSAGVRLTLQKSNQMQQAPKVLKGVLVLSNGRAYEIAAPVAAHDGTGPPGR